MIIFTEGADIFGHDCIYNILFLLQNFTFNSMYYRVVLIIVKFTSDQFLSENCSQVNPTLISLWGEFITVCYRIVFFAKDKCETQKKVS